MTKRDDARLRAALAARRQELEERLTRIRANLGRRLDPDSKERAKELEDSDVVDALGNDATEELALIRRTLGRLDDGSYGNCSDCGDAIGEARLKAYPYADRCIDCAEAEERQQRLA